MVSGGTVTGDLNSLTSNISKFSAEIAGLSGSWKGASYDGLSSKTESFVSDYSSTITGQMNAFASACDLYQEYVQCKSDISTAQNSYNSAVSNKDSSAMTSYGNQVATLKSKLNNLKTQIEGYLSTASSGKLTATRNLASAATTTGTDTNEEKTSNVTGTAPTTGNVINTSSPVGTGTKYNLSNDEIAYLAHVAKREQGSVDGAKLELSLMINLYEKNKSKYSSVVDYVKRSGWFATRSTSSYSYPGDDYVSAAKEVVIDGNRYLPSNVVEHDCLSDIKTISSGSVNNRSDYIPGKTIIENRYGARYVFVGFAPNGGDPFGYLVK